MATRSKHSEGPARRHARALLALLGVGGEPGGDADHPALGWRRAGLMRVTGRPDGLGLVAPVALTSAADGALAALRMLAPGAALPANGAMLLGERARLLGLTRGGRVSPGGSCRLIATSDGRIALNLPRADDWALMPALLGAEAGDWAAVERLAVGHDRAALLEQGRLLGLGVAADAPAPEAPPFVIEPVVPPRRRAGPPVVVDLSALWAGPLAASLLGAAGARVIKVESVRRPDGARAGNAHFHDLLNAGKESVALDFTEAGDVRRLHRLIAAADIVIESSRPRALAALGVDAAEVARAGATWLSITAYGRDGAAADRIGFGDDAAVAGGLSAVMARSWGAPLFAGDAIADPLTGITAALAGWAAWLGGGGRLVSLAMADVVANACALDEAEDVHAWQAFAQADTAPLYPLRESSGIARPLGADTATVMRVLSAG